MDPRRPSLAKRCSRLPFRGPFASGPPERSSSGRRGDLQSRDDPASNDVITMTRLELSIAWRYLRSRRGSRLLSLISAIAIGG